MNVLQKIEMTSKLLADLEEHGEGFITLFPTPNSVACHLEAGRVNPVYDDYDGARLVGWTYTNEDGTVVTFDADRVLHFIN